MNKHQIYIFKITKVVAILLLPLLFLACPSSDDNCDDYGSSTRVENLIWLTPEQGIYSQGDELTLKIEIPATNDYFGSELNIFQETADTSALMVFQFNQIFIDNELTFIKGSQQPTESNNWFNMPYNYETEQYELEIVITLNRLGNYSFTFSGSIEFIGDNCNRYRLDTTIDWNYTNGRVEFVVE